MVTEKKDDVADTSLLATGLRMAKDHILLSTLGILAILLAFTFTLGRGDNTSFVQTLLSLLGVSFAIFFTFSPTPSMWRGLASLVVAFFWVSLLLDAPIKLRSAVNQLLQTFIAVSDNPGATVPTPTVGSRPPPGPQNPPPEDLPRLTYEERPFSATGSSVNVGCGQTASSTVIYGLPNNAQVVSLVANWINTSNLSNVVATPVVLPDANAVQVTGTITGLRPQQILLGISNCPGGGHGTLTISGVIRVPTSTR